MSFSQNLPYQVPSDSNLKKQKDMYKSDDSTPDKILSRSSNTSNKDYIGIRPAFHPNDIFSPELKEKGQLLFSDDSPQVIKKQISKKDLNKMNSMTAKIQTFYTSTSYIGTLMIILTYIITDIQKKPRSFKIGVFSIFIVVGFLVLMQSALQLSSVVFLKIAEGQVGDTDIIMTPLAATNDSRLNSKDFSSNPFNSFRLLNGHEIEPVCDVLDVTMGCSPRWVLFADAYNPENNNDKIRVFIIAIDSAKEKSIGIGRNLNSPILGTNASLVTFSTKTSLALKDKVKINIDIIKALVSQGALSLDDIISVSRNGSIEDMTEDQKIEVFKESLKDSMKDFLYTNLISIFNESQFINTTILKQNANETRRIINESNIPNDANISYFYPNNSNVSTYFSEYLGISPALVESFKWTSVKNITDYLDYVDKLPDNLTINLNNTIEILVNSLINIFNLTSILNIKSEVISPKGKWTEALGNVIVFEYSDINNILYENFNNSLTSEINKNKTDKDSIQNTFFLNESNILNSIKNTILNIDLRGYTMSENIIIKNRINVYSDESVIRDNFIDITNKLMKKLGKNYPCNNNIPLSGAVGAVLIVKNFLDNIFVSAVFILILLSILLIYSLMLSNIDEKTYEFGMLRALGIKSTSLIALLLIQGLIYAIPGMSLGFIFSYLINAAVSYTIFDYALEASSFELHYSAIIIGFMLGIIMPLIANSLPIYRALSKTLKDSLDLFHRVIDEMSVNIMKLEKLGISFAQFIDALTLIIMGITTYYFAPLAFVQQNIKLFLAIMNIVLVFLILGFTIFINLFQNLFQKLLIKIFLLIFYKDKFLESIILKNMSAHNKRNSKTALMFCICLAFLIFAGAGFNLQANVIENTLKLQIGSDMTCEVSESESVGLQEYNLRVFLENYKKKHPKNIESYSFVSFPMETMPDIKKPVLSPLSGYPSSNVKIYGIESNFLQTTFTKFYLPTENDPTATYPNLKDGKSDGVSALFSMEGIQNSTEQLDEQSILSNQPYRSLSSFGIDQIIKIIIPEGARTGMAIDTGTPAVIEIGDKKDKFKTRIRGMASKVPGFGFQFSSYQTITSNLVALTSIEQLKKMVDIQWKRNIDKQLTKKINDFYKTKPKNLTFGLPKRKLYVKFSRYLNNLERIELANGMRNYFTNDLTILLDTNSMLEEAQSAFYFIDLFYIIVSFISVILSFFLILVSFVSNVKENSWEFGVLRAIGLNKFQMTRIYVYEAVALTISSGILGTTVGIVVAITLVLQILIFTELPFEFLFPTNIFCITFFFGIFTSAIGSYYAVKEIRDKPISDITKGLI